MSDLTILALIILIIGIIFIIVGIVGVYQQRRTGKQDVINYTQPKSPSDSSIAERIRKDEDFKRKIKSIIEEQKGANQ